ncbi:MAG: transposase [Actinomycetota bacterium]|nr:transposase [Actinomycetota bacterium]
MLVTAGDDPDRLRSEAAFARLCGVAPILANSGHTNRHRLNPRWRPGSQHRAAHHRTIPTALGPAPVRPGPVARRRTYQTRSHPMFQIDHPRGLSSTHQPRTPPERQTRSGLANKPSGAPLELNVGSRSTVVGFGVSSDGAWGRGRGGGLPGGDPAAGSAQAPGAGAPQVVASAMARIPTV